MPFVEAVRTLCDGRAAPSLSQPVKNSPEPRPFVLPEVSRCATAAVAYLQRRGIDWKIISRCIRAGIFYESSRYHNCVFVGRDRAGNARFASMRGTMGRTWRAATNGLTSVSRPVPPRAEPWRYSRAP